MGDPVSADDLLAQGWWPVNLRLKHPALTEIVEGGEQGLLEHNPIIASENEEESKYVMGGRAQSTDRASFKVVLRESWVLGVKATQ